MGIDTWSEVVSEITAEFGPYRSATAAKRSMFTLKCQPNQSSREFLSVLKTAYSPPERNPEFESCEFIQFFNDALPNKTEGILARYYHGRKSLDWLLTESHGNASYHLNPFSNWVIHSRRGTGGVLWGGK